MATSERWPRLPRSLESLRAIDRLARTLANHERSEPFHRGQVGLSLQAMRRFVRRLSDPLRGIPVVHVAGSKGKGSVCVLLESLLRAQGLKTGLYLSPHVDAWNERVQIDGRPIAPALLGRHLLAVLRVARRDARPPTLFETLTAAAFQAFRRAQVDVAIVEVGIGGRLDATNVVLPEVAVVTSLEREHVKVLGPTLAAIAREKAGIFKRGAAAVSGVPSGSPAAAVLRRVARARRAAPLVEWGRDLNVVPRGDRFVLRRRGAKRLELPTPAGGPFATRNAALAVSALEQLARRRPELHLSSSDRERLAAGLAAARLPGRLELVASRPLTWRDGAHTPNSLRAVVKAVAARAGVRPVVVLALKSDKPLARCVAALKGEAGPVVATSVPGGRGHSPEEIVAAARRHGIMARSIPDPRRAIAFARRLAGRSGAALVTGSFWLVGLANGAWICRSSTISS